MPGVSSKTPESGASVTLENAGGDLVGNDEESNEAQRAHSQDNQMPGVSSKTPESGASVTLENAGGDLVRNDEESSRAKIPHIKDCLRPDVPSKAEGQSQISI